MTPFNRLLSILVQNKVEFVLIGGLAASLHGSERTTGDIDIVYRRTEENIRRLVDALKPLSPRLRIGRGAEEELPFIFDERTILMGESFTLRTSIADIDLLASATGRSYDDILQNSQRIRLEFGEIDVVTIDALIDLKRAAGRKKDVEHIAELEYLRDVLRKSSE